MKTSQAKQRSYMVGLAIVTFARHLPVFSHIYFLNSSAWLWISGTTFPRLPCPVFLIDFTKGGICRSLVTRRQREARVSLPFTVLLLVVSKQLLHHLHYSSSCWISPSLCILSSCWEVLPGRLSSCSGYFWSLLTLLPPCIFAFHAPDSGILQLLISKLPLEFKVLFGILTMRITDKGRFTWLLFEMWATSVL